MPSPIGLHSLAVSVPDRVLTNDHWRESQPQLVAAAVERLGRCQQEGAENAWREEIDRDLAPYLEDPFRGAVERRVLGAGGTALELEAQAAREALAVAGREPEDVDLLICTSLLPDRQGIGGATPLARELGLAGAAWNIDSQAASALVAFQTACSLISTGQCRRALVVTSCTWSRAAPEDDPIAWSVGDAAAAMIVGPVAAPAGYLGGHSVHSDGARALVHQLEVGPEGRPRVRLGVRAEGRQPGGRTSRRTLERCAGRALEKAGLALEDVDHLVVSTPIAGYAASCARTLGIDRGQTFSTYPIFADAGPALLGLNLLHAARWRRFEPGDAVLLYADGSFASCSAAIMRWGDVALGELPTDTPLAKLEELEAETLDSYRLRRLEAEVLAPARDIGEAEARLRRVVSSYVSLAIDEPGIMTLFAGEAAQRASRSANLRQRAERYLQALESDVTEVFRAQKRSAPLDPTVATLSLLGIVHWGVCSFRAEGRLSREEAIEQISYLALHGLVSSPGPSRGAYWVGRKL